MEGRVKLMCQASDARELWWQLVPLRHRRLVGFNTALELHHSYTAVAQARYNTAQGALATAPILCSYHNITTIEHSMA